MIEPKAHSERDVEINRVVTEIVRIVKDKGVEPTRDENNGLQTANWMM